MVHIGYGLDDYNFSRLIFKLPHLKMLDGDGYIRLDLEALESLGVLSHVRFPTHNLNFGEPS